MSAVFSCPEPAARALIDGHHELDVRGLHEQAVAPQERRQHERLRRPEVDAHHGEDLGARRIGRSTQEGTATFENTSD